jgi:uncharacterized membrane protein YphA (DoxX/SURF4 family)
MKALAQHPWLGVLTRLVVGGIFIYASLDKILHPEGFARIIFNYHLVPAPLINLVAIVLPWVEFGAGLFLVLGIWPRASGFILTGLVVIFLIALSVNWLRGVNLECGCFSVSGKGKSAIGELIVRDIVLLLLALQTTFWARPKAWLTDRA